MIFMCIYWGYMFSLDEDISVVKYRKFQEREKDDYPTVSFCLANPFLKQRLSAHGVNESLYLKFLKAYYRSEIVLHQNL